MWDRSAQVPEKIHKEASDGLFKEMILGNKANAPENQRPNAINSIIEGLTVTPKRPTVLDELKVVVKARNPNKGNLSYQYQWQINEKAVEVANGNVLPAGFARKNDSIAITVIPFVDGVKYKEFHYTVHAAIYNAEPTLFLKEETRREGDVIEFQLKAEDPDGDKIHYALEEPLLEGMTIDKDTGKINWKLGKKQKGTYRFAASATDTDGSKTTKTFEFSLDTK